MGLEKWLHEKLAPLMQTDKEYLFVVVGLAAIAMFLYAIISN
jgi:hypothetical protein